MLQRPQYLNKLIGFKNKKLIKIITGIRRCGKSTLLALFQEHLLASGVNNDQIIAINFENADYFNLSDYLSLYQYIKDRLSPDRMNYVLLDEIQQVEQFQKAVDSLFIMANVDIYITGSNAHLLSGELATLLAGRYVEIQMLPLSFKEYISFWPDQSDISRKFQTYLQFSSFPYALELDNNPELIRDYLSGVYSTIVLKDVIARNKIDDSLMLESVVRFLFDNIGSVWSTKRISDTMTAAGRKISTHTVEKYVAALIESFIIYRANRYDIKGKQFLKTQEKYYIVDIGLRYFLLGGKRADIGHILENVIYLELRRRGYNVFIGKMDTQEVDFVATNRNGTEYFQVCKTVRDPSILRRELLPLERIPDKYPKYLITSDDDPPVDYNGIKQINAIDFLLA